MYPIAFYVFEGVFYATIYSYFITGFGAGNISIIFSIINVYFFLLIILNHLTHKSTYIFEGPHIANIIF